MAANSALVTDGGVQIVDFFATKLTQGLSIDSTTMFIGSVAGLPALTETSYVLFLIEEGTTFEIVKGIGLNASLKSVTIARAYGGTDPRTFSREAKVEIRITSALLNEFARAANTNYLEERFIQTKSTVDALSSVATSGAYSDLSGAPILFPIATTGNYNDLSNKPDLASEARSSISIAGSSAEGTSYNSSTGAITVASPSSSGDIGAMVFAYPVNTSSTFTYGSTLSASSGNRLRPAGISPDDPDGLRDNGSSDDIINGTWKCLGYSRRWSDSSDGSVTYYDQDTRADGFFGSVNDYSANRSASLSGDGTQYVATMWHRIS